MRINRRSLVKAGLWAPAVAPAVFGACTLGPGTPVVTTGGTKLGDMASQGEGLRLPGRLGDPTITSLSDPRLDPRLAEFWSARRSGLEDALQDSVEDAPKLDLRAALESIAELESYSVPMMDGWVKDLPPIRDVRRSTTSIEGVDGNEIKLYIHEPGDRDCLAKPKPGLVHMHGGGMALSAASDPFNVRWRDELAEAGLLVIGVEFRNAAGKLGNHPFPAGLNDCASATQWAHRTKESLGAAGFIVSGESGGGNLCIATALKARQEGWVDAIAGVYSMCPYILGDYSNPPPELLSHRENLYSGKMGESDGPFVLAYDPTDENSRNPLAWPYQARRQDLVGLPPHVISVNELDVLRDEGIFYARKLLAAGVSTISRTINGTSHGADMGMAVAIPDIHAATLHDVVGFAERVTSEG